MDAVAAVLAGEVGVGVTAAQCLGSGVKDRRTATVAAGPSAAMTGEAVVVHFHRMGS